MTENFVVSQSFHTHLSLLIGVLKTNRVIVQDPEDETIETKIEVLHRFGTPAELDPLSVSLG